MLGLVGGERVGWQGHVIVCGLADLGLRIVEQLALSGVPAVVVDDDPAPALARMLAAWGVPLVTGPARAEETLMSAGLAEAVAVICAQDNDLSALETALLARRLRAEVRVVAQLTNPAVGRAVKEAGVAVLDVAGLSAPSVVEVCLGEGVQEMSLSGMRFLAARTTAPSAATLRELYGALAPVAVVPGRRRARLPWPGHRGQRGRRGDAHRHPRRARRRRHHRPSRADPPSHRHRRSQPGTGVARGSRRPRR